MRKSILIERFYWDFYSCQFINPRLTKLFFVTRLTKGGCYNPLPIDFPNRTPYKIDFGINR